jgi:phosphatidylglycerol---prolipoprotein diacylglyceryl transferase
MRSILFHLGSIPVRAYGFMIVVGFALGLWRATKVSARYKINHERVMDAALLALLAGIVGARVLYLFLQVPQEGWAVFSQILRVWEGGLSFHGGLIAAIAVVALYTRAKKIPFLTMADLLAPSLAIGYAFARIGCFLNGCCYGRPTDLPWGVCFVDPVTHVRTAPSHPAQLYAFAASLLIFAILTRIEKLNRTAGFVFFSYVVLYSIYRFLIEFIRKGVTAEVWFLGLTQAQVISLAAILIFGIVLLIQSKHVPKQTAEKRKTGKHRKH